MNTAPIYEPIYSALKPTRRLLMQLIAVKSGGIYNRRAERLQLRGMFRGWPEAVIEQLLARLLEHAEAIENAFIAAEAERRHGSRDEYHLARVNGRGLAGQYPAYVSAKTPAARERVCHVVAATGNGGVPAPRESVQQSATPIAPMPRGAIV